MSKRKSKYQYKLTIIDRTLYVEDAGDAWVVGTVQLFFDTLEEASEFIEKKISENLNAYNIIYYVITLNGEIITEARPRPYLTTKE